MHLDINDIDTMSIRNVIAYIIGLLVLECSVVCFFLFDCYQLSCIR